MWKIGLHFITYYLNNLLFMTSSKYIVFVTTLSVFWPRNVVKRTCYQSAAQQVGLAAPMIG